MANGELEKLIRDGHEIVGRGTEAVVVVGPASDQVTKIYIWHTLDEALRAAEREFQVLREMSQPRSSAIRTPRPIAINRSPPIGIVMERCSGMALPEYIISNAWDYSLLPTQLGDLLDFVFEYVALRNEPYRDFEPGNIIYHAETKILTAIDFSTGRCSKPTLHRGDSFIAASVAEFISALIFCTLRPKTIFDVTLRSRSILLCEAMLTGFSARLPTAEALLELDQLSRRALDTRFASLDPARRYWFNMAWRLTRKHWPSPGLAG